MRFKVGDIVNSSLSSPKEIIDIRIGLPEDFPTTILGNGVPFRLSFENKMCYILKSLHGNGRISAYSIECVDSDHHLKGSEMFELYQEWRNELKTKL